MVVVTTALSLPAVNRKVQYYGLNIYTVETTCMHETNSHQNFRFYTRTGECFVFSMADYLSRHTTPRNNNKLKADELWNRWSSVKENNFKKACFKRSRKDEEL